MRVLYLDTGFDSSSEYFRVQREKVKKCTNKCLYKTSHKSLGQKILLVLGIYLFPPVLYWVYGDWKKELENYDVFILVSRKSAQYAAKYIKKKAPNKRVIIWYWNLVTNKEMNPDYCRKIGCEPWSFDKTDCKKYRMKFGDTYYFPPDNIMDNQSEHCVNQMWCVFYVGINRPGRKEFLDHLRKFLQSKGMKYKFNLTAIPSKKRPKDDQLSERMTYEQIIDSICKSKAILDLNRENQSGMTLRPMEALFFKRKLVTNNRSIIQYKIYDADNTYIIENKDFDGLDAFLSSVYVESKENEEKRKAYSFDSWLDRMLSNTEAIYVSSRNMEE